MREQTEELKMQSGEAYVSGGKYYFTGEQYFKKCESQNFAIVIVYWVNVGIAQCFAQNSQSIQAD